MDRLFAKTLCPAGNRRTSDTTDSNCSRGKPPLSPFVCFGGVALWITLSVSAGAQAPLDGLSGGSTDTTSRAGIGLSSDAAADSVPVLPPVESVDAATRSMWLIEGTVVDATTGEPIPSVIMTPGSLGTDEQGRTSVRWRDNLKREMSDGLVRWPRTSGFSLMRFRLTAPGYQPAITQRVWRGGPHSRLTVRLRRETP